MQYCEEIPLHTEAADTDARGRLMLLMGLAVLKAAADLKGSVLGTSNVTAGCFAMLCNCLFLTICNHPAKHLHAEDIYHVHVDQD